MNTIDIKTENTLPSSTFNIYDEIKKICLQYPSKIALQEKTPTELKKYTFEQLNEYVDKGKKKLLDMGLKPGDRIAILSENRVEWILSYISILAARGTTVPLDSMLPLDELQQLIEFSDSKGLFISEEFDSKKELKIPDFTLRMNLETFFSEEKPSNSHFREETKDNDESLANIVFTSGTTGVPKGVMLTHTNIIQNCKATQILVDVCEKDHFLCILPLNHMYSLGTIVLVALTSGAAVTVLNVKYKELLLSTLNEEKITILVAVPRLYEAIYAGILSKVKEKGAAAYQIFNSLLKISSALKRKIGVNLGKKLFKKIHEKLGTQLRALCSGGAAISTHLLEQYEALGIKILNGYGSTEYSPIISGMRLSDEANKSAGKPVSGCQVRINQPNIDGEGEILVKGPSLMKGYFRNEEATNNAMIEGWYRTGDLGKFNKEGYLYITGRIKEIIVTSSGKKISPEQIESLYAPIPHAKEFGVTGIHRIDRFGEEITGVIVLDIPPNEKNIEALQKTVEDWILERSKSIPPYLRLQKIYFLNEIPKTTTLKIKRKKIKKLIEESDLIKNPQSTAAKEFLQIIDDETTQKIIEIIYREKHQSIPSKTSLTLDSSLQFDLGIDSLDRLSIASEIQKAFNVTLDLNKISYCSTLRDLSSLIKEYQKNLPREDTGTLSNENVNINPSWFTSIIAYSLPKLSKKIWDIEVDGIENIPEDTVCIFTPNHTSHLDVFWLLGSLPNRFNKKLKTLAKAEHFKRFFTRHLAYATGGIPVERTGDFTSAYHQASNALKDGYSLIIFPEGTRTRTGTLGSFFRGATELALKEQVPIVPVWIEGGYEVYPRHKTLPKIFNWKNRSRYKIKIIFGKPLLPPFKEGAQETSPNQLLRDHVEKLAKK